MKHLLTLAFLFFSLLSFGQKALSGSMLLQDNGQDLQFTSTLGNLRIEREYEIKQIPTFAATYFNFQESGRYNKWQLSGWRFNKITDIETAYEDSTGLIEPTNGNDLLLASGRIGFAKGWSITPKDEKLHLFVEVSLNAGWQYAEYNPRTSQDFPRTFFGTSTQLGPNLVLQKDFERGFLRVAVLAPVLQFSTEYSRIENPLFSLSANTTSASSFDVDGWKHGGLELGGGFFLGK